MQSKEARELESSVHKLERKNTTLKRECAKLKKDNSILLDENELLQAKIKEIVRESQEQLAAIKARLIELGEEALIPAFED